MRFLYMVEYKLAGDAYVPIGVWCVGETPGLDVEIRMLPGYPEEQEEADRVINRLVESGAEHAGREFLEYHQETLSPYRGMRSKVFETDQYPNREALFTDLFKQIQEGRIR
ncbi:MAG TPA: hypothetical protein P5532_12000 [Planctomycetota bacterium]|nr:hypothetical protein [Planctomycetota bacterium]